VTLGLLIGTLEIQELKYSDSDVEYIDFLKQWEKMEYPEENPILA